MPSKPPSVRSISPSPSQVNEVTTLLPSSSRPGTPNRTAGKTHTHTRKASVGTGSIRHYGSTNRPGPVEQAPRVSKVGQRRILTTFPLQVVFFILVFLTFLSLILTLLLFLNTALDFDGITPPYRGSGFTEFWISVVGSWIGLGGVFFFSHPSYLFFLTSLLTFILHIPLILLILLNKPLNAAHIPLLIAPFSLTALVVIFSLLANFLVRRARRRESERVYRMLSDAAGREQRSEESTARALVGVQGKGFWGGLVGVVSGIVGLIAGLAGAILVTLLLIDLVVSAYDHGIDLPSSSSSLYNVQPKGIPWSSKVHLACTSPKESTNKTFPTILYEPPSGVPGSLALFPFPLIPSDEESVNAGRWIMDMQEKGEVGKVCVWDRPGYGFSQVMSGADLGHVADALWLALKAAEVEGPFTLVGEGYGGLITRVIASRHPRQVHSLLHIEAQTAQTYFSENPNGRSAAGLLIHRIATRQLPSLLTPLSLTRLPSIILRRSSSLSRTLASSHPGPSTVHLNENMRKARLQETWGSHSHTSSSFRALLESGLKYPKGKPAIVISSSGRMEKDSDWEEGQRGLAEEVTGKKGLMDWKKVEGGKWVCEGEGRRVCEESLRSLIGGK